MKYTIKVNEVKKQDSNVKGFATVVFGDSFKITKYRNCPEQGEWEALCINAEI